MTAEVKDKMAPPLLEEEFGDVNRHWDSAKSAWIARISPGEYYVTAHNEVISTVLGSCIAVYVRDRKSKMGGMNHFMLPHANTYQGDTTSKLLSIAGRYGNLAMEKLINCILSNGGSRNELEFKVFGGAKVLDIDSSVGDRNIQFISEYLRIESFSVESQDVGGSWPRKINYYPETGEVLMKKLRKIRSTYVSSREHKYYRQLDQAPAAENEVTFFTS